MSKSLNNYLSIIQSTKNLSLLQEESIIFKAQNGNTKAKDDLFLTHLKMVFKIAKGYNIQNIGFEDLVSEGILGLEDALKHYDIKRGYRFSTMARWWVRAKMLSYIRRNIRIFDVPTATSDKIYAINKSIERLGKQRNQVPSNGDIALDLGLKESRVGFLRKYLIPSISMNQKIESNGTSNGSDSGGQIIQDLFLDDRNNGKEALIRNDGVEKIREALKGLPPRQRIIIEWRYGLKGKELTLKQISGKLKLTTQRIHQIQYKAEARLKKLINI